MYNGKQYEIMKRANTNSCIVKTANVNKQMKVTKLTQEFFFFLPHTPFPMSKKKVFIFIFRYGPRFFLLHAESGRLRTTMPPLEDEMPCHNDIPEAVMIDVFKVFKKPFLPYKNMFSDKVLYNGRNASRQNTSAMMMFTV